jgi:hypothetical protein
MQGCARRTPIAHRDLLTHVTVLADDAADLWRLVRGNPSSGDLAV